MTSRSKRKPRLRAAVWNVPPHHPLLARLGNELAEHPLAPKDGPPTGVTVRWARDRRTISSICVSYGEGKEVVLRRLASGRWNLVFRFKAIAQGGKVAMETIELTA